MNTRMELRKLLHYNPNTGVFTRLQSKRGDLVGQIAGSKCWGGSTYYTRIWINHKSYRAHQLAFLYVEGYIPKLIDYIDGNGLNNKWDNLRSVDVVTNARNHTVYSHNKTGISGVSNTCGYYHVYIYLHNKKHSLGNTVDFFEACCLRKSAEVKYGFCAR